MQQKIKLVESPKNDAALDTWPSELSRRPPELLTPPARASPYLTWACFFNGWYVTDAAVPWKGDTFMGFEFESKFSEKCFHVPLGRTKVNWHALLNNNTRHILCKYGVSLYLLINLVNGRRITDIIHLSSELFLKLESDMLASQSTWVNGKLTPRKPTDTCRTRRRCSRMSGELSKRLAAYICHLVVAIPSEPKQPKVRAWSFWDRKV